MRFGDVPLDQAEGSIVAHTLRLPGGVLKKGTRLGPEEVSRLRAAGLSSVVAARLDPDDVSEDEAARRIADVVAGAGVRVAEAKTGRANLFATARGLLVLDSARLLRLNEVDEALTVATAQPNGLVERGDMVATVKVIPFAAPTASVDESCEIASAAVIRVEPFAKREAGLVLTRLPGMPETLLDRAAKTQRARMRRLGGGIVEERRCVHSVAEVAAAIEALADAGRDPILLFGASAIVDRRDVLPSALEQAGGHVEHLGMPVDPGNLLMLGHYRETTVIGVPGCARSLKRSGFDQVLERVVAGLPVARADIARMGEGGLLKEDPERPHPRLSDRDREPLVVATVVLAAGQSRRMGEANKLLEEVGGRAMLARVVDAALASAATETVVVTGHDEKRVRAALEGLDVRFAHNPDYDEGLSTSVRTGVDAVGDACDAALFLLGDMPWIRGAHLDRLIEAFDPASGSSICVPVYERKRGNPVLWSSRHFAEMRALVGDVGARRLLTEHADQVRLVDMDDAGVLVDVDTPAALEELRDERPS